MDIRIDRCVLHGPEGDVRRAQRILMSCPWPPLPEGEVLILRRVGVQARPERLPARLYQVTDGLMGQRVDGWSEAAAGADCVCFRSEADMLARLSLDLVAGRAAGLWFWQSFRYCRVTPPPLALAHLWLDQAPRLPAVIRVLRERGELPRVWSRLEVSAASALLARILGSATAAELRRGPGEPAAAATGSAFSRRSVPARDESPPAEDALIAAVAAFGTRPGAHDSDRDKGLLALTLAVAAERPHWIAAADSARRLIELRAAIEQLAEAPPRPLAAAPSPPERPVVEGPPRRPSRPAAWGSDVEAGASARGMASTSGASQASGAMPAGEADEDRSRLDTMPPAAAPDAEAREPQIARGVDSGAIPADSGDVWHVEQGGLFYLLNVLSWRPVRERLFGDAEAMAFPSGWGWLYRVGERLALAPEVPLLHCLTRLSGMPDGRFPADLPELTAAAEIAALAAERYEPFGIWHPRLLQMPALVVLRRPELDIHFAQSDLDIDVRRAGLDVDPGWIDWLGTLTRFHYR